MTQPLESTTAEDRDEGLVLPPAVHEAEASALARAYERFHEAEVTPPVERGTDDQQSFIIVPAGKRIVDPRRLLNRFRRFPERKRGTARFSELASFIQHFNRFADEDSVVFVDVITTPSKPRLVAVLDYDRAASASAGSGGARHGEHRAIYDFPLSDEWKAWVANNGPSNPMTMQAFANFLDERILEVTTGEGLKPDDIASQIAAALNIRWASPQKLMQLSRGVETNVSMQHAEFINQQSGAKQVVFKEEFTGPASAPLDIPEGFLIKVPIFRGEAPWVIPVQLRFRPKGGMKWFYEVYRADRHLLEAVDRAAKRVSDETKHPVYFGLPEHLSSELESYKRGDRAACDGDEQDD